MIKRFCLSLALALAATLLVVVPVLAAYYAYIYIEESAGNSYDQLAMSCPANITRLIEGDFMSSTGLDTRVLTGSGDVLPHMVADDKVLFVSDLDAYEDKTLIFYMGATSLSSFPVVVGYNGSFTTPDDPDLELGYVMELLVDGYFDASAGSDKNILYKDDAFRMWISAANTLKVAAYNSTGDEQWECHYSNFTTGEHTVYLVCNGMQALLYVDNFVTAKDTANLWANANEQMTGTTDLIPEQAAFYTNGRYWCFYLADSNTFAWRTSTDGDTWEVEQTVDFNAADTTDKATAIYGRDGYVHLIYTNTGNNITYRRGAANSNGTITWSDVWQVAVDASGIAATLSLAVDVNGYPFITYSDTTSAQIMKCTKSSTNNGTWTTAGGYPFNINAFNAGWGRIAAYYNNDDMYIMYISITAGGHTLEGDYYNGSTWGGLHTIDTSTADFWDFGAVGNSDGDLFIVWLERDNLGNCAYFMRTRYANGTWGAVTEVGDATSYLENCSVSYNPETDGVYIFHNKAADAALYGYVLFGDTLIGPYTFSSASTYIGDLESGAYGNSTGIATSNDNSRVNHQYLTYSWVWNDNANDWYWMQNNVMAYADDFQIAVDGALQLEYKPASIIQGTTLPDEESNHDATITWGSNPSGVNVTMSELQFDQSYNETYYYQYLSPGSTDIINPEPEVMTGDVDLERLHGNPLYPLVQVLTIAGFLNERLAWLGLAWFILIVAMFIVHLGVDTRKDTEKPQHFVLTTITGMGLSILFYTMGIFPWWVMLLMALGLIGAIIWERQPVI